MRENRSSGSVEGVGRKARSLLRPGAGGSFWVSAKSGQVTGSGTISVRGGVGGMGTGSPACGGGGGGGGGIISLSARIAGPKLVTLIEGAAGALGQLVRP